eukprot:2340153-Rhodomonas_salina.1
MKEESERRMRAGEQHTLSVRHTLLCEREAERFITPSPGQQSLPPLFLLLRKSNRGRGCESAQKGFGVQIVKTLPVSKHFKKLTEAIILPVPVSIAASATGVETCRVEKFGAKQT